MISHMADFLCAKVNRVFALRAYDSHLVQGKAVITVAFINTAAEMVLKCERMHIMTNKT